LAVVHDITCSLFHSLLVRTF